MLDNGYSWQVTESLEWRAAITGDGSGMMRLSITPLASAATEWRARWTVTMC